MNAYAHQRKSLRFQSNAEVMIGDFRTRFHYKGTLYNYSSAGGYVESDYAPRPGRKIHLNVDGLPDVIAPQVYLAEVRWRKPLVRNNSSYSFGVGIRYS